MAPDSGLQARVAQLEEELATQRAQVRAAGSCERWGPPARPGVLSGPSCMLISRSASLSQAEAAAIGAEQAAQVRRRP